MKKCQASAPLQGLLRILSALVLMSDVMSESRVLAVVVFYAVMEAS